MARDVPRTKKFSQVIYLNTEFTGPAVLAIFHDGTAAIRSLTLRNAPWETFHAPLSPHLQNLVDTRMARKRV